MKKNVFFALFALAALVFVGCEPNTPTPDGGTTDAVISVTPETLLMAAGETQKLTATVTPQGTQLQITWTSDNQEVVTVSPAGIVTAVAAGKANIIASAEGATADTCVVTVSNDAVLDNFAIGGYGCFGVGGMIPGSETMVILTSGDSLKCQLAEALWYVWDDGIVMAGDQLSGAGFLLEIVAPLYVVTEEGAAQGALIGGGGIWVDTLSEGTYDPYVGQAGQLVDIQKYGDAWKEILSWEEEPSEEVLEATYDLYYESQVGTPFYHIDFNTGAQSYYYGNVSYASVVEAEDGLQYQVKLEWYDNINEGRVYGLAAEEVVSEAGDTTLALVEPYDMRVVNKIYTNVPLEDETTEVSGFKQIKVIQLCEESMRIINETKKMYKK